MRRDLLLGAIGGMVWSALAIVVFVGMRNGVLPAPGEAAIPVALGLAIAYLPFIVGAGLETLVGRGSASFAELLLATAVSGASLGTVVGSLASLASRRQR